MSRIVKCPQCTQLNRLPATLAPGAYVRCGKCRFLLSEDEDDEEEVFDIEGGQE
jgi:phage FluMu protein Com